MSSTFSKTLFLLFVVSTRYYGGAVTYQQISFYSEPNQGGSRFPLSDNLPAAIPSAISDSKSFCVDNGLWEASLELPTTSQAPTAIQHYGGTVGTSFCLNRQEPLSTFLSLKFIGSRDLAQPSITLFGKSKYLGTFEYFNSSKPEFSFDSPLEINSYFITGAQNWATYNGTNYSGTWSCLQAATATNSEDDSTYGAKGVAYLDPLKVSSITLGCPGDEESTTRRTTNGAIHSAAKLNIIPLLLSIQLLIFIHRNR